jgi:hypothetical protein
MKLKNTFWIVCLWVFLCFLSKNPALAQDEEPDLEMSMSRDFGYASGTGDIQGTFSMRVKGPEDLSKVEFMIDDEVIFEDTEAPYRYQFNTDSYPLGMHTLYARGYTQNGETYISNEARVNFVSAEESTKFLVRFLVPLFSLILGLMALSYIVPIIFRRGKPTPLGATRNYGLVGGTVCKHCQRPFALNLFAPNVLVGKLDRCPHCGKWGIVRSQSLEVLRAAEKAELAESNAGQNSEVGLSEEAKFKKAIDDSRFQDS